MSIPSPGPKPVLLFGADSSGIVVPVTSAPPDSDSNPVTSEGIETLAYLYGFNGATWDRVRVANTFKTASVTASGATAIWSPGAGSFFRLMGFSISVAGDLGSAGIQTVQLRDGSSTIFKNFVCYLGAALAAGETTVFAEDMGQGYLSAAAANDLYIVLGTTMTAGAVTINAWGTQGATA